MKYRKADKPPDERSVTIPMLHIIIFILPTQNLRMYLNTTRPIFM